MPLSAFSWLFIQKRSLVYIFFIKCSRTKFEAIIANVLFFSIQFFLLDRFDFSSDFCALDFLILGDLNLFLIHKCQQLDSRGAGSLLK